MSKPLKVKKEDLTGKDRLIWNAFVSWSSHLVLVISGFVMPRLMEQELGQELLGSWDFCWTFITYLKFVGLGVGNGSNRYVAKYRSENDITSLNRLISSVITIQFFVGISLTIATLSIAYFLPNYFYEELGENLIAIQLVIIFLGISLAVNMFFSASRGILTGYHRWDLHNGLTACYSVLSVIFMMTMLFSGFGIVGMAQAYLANTVLFELIRVVVTRKYCKGFNIAASLVTKKQCWELICFSSKNKLTTLPPIFILQSVNFMIIGGLGLSSLAIFARSLALTRHITTFMSKFTMMLTPSISSMLGSEHKGELLSFYLMTTRLSFAFTLPLVLTIIILGDLIILLWMGPNYVNQTMTIILALGVLLPAAQDCSLRLLMGMNEHGRISAYVLCVVLGSFGCFYAYFYNKTFSLEIAALAFVVPLNLANGILMPIYTCNKLKLNLIKYFKCSILTPFFSVLPFACLLIIFRHYYLQSEYLIAFSSLFFATVSLIVSYGFFVLNKEQRKKVVNKFYRGKNESII